jgi:hypothetical protein
LYKNWIYLCKKVPWNDRRVHGREEDYTLWIPTKACSSRRCKALVLGSGRTLEADATVGPEAAASDLAAAGAPQVAHLDHGRAELVEERRLAVGESVDQGLGGGVVEQPLVGGEHALTVPQVDEVPVVEGVRRAHVQVLLPARTGGALLRQPPRELVVVHPDEPAASLPDGVAAGERHEVGRVS